MGMCFCTSEVTVHKICSRFARKALPRPERWLVLAAGFVFERGALMGQGMFQVVGIGEAESQNKKVLLTRSLQSRHKRS